MAGRRSDSDARETRRLVLRRAADIASVEGLGGVTIGRLATDLGMSKAGVIGQFGSKEALQLATIDLAAGMFREAVWAPVEEEAPGLPRLLAICRSWVAYLGDPPFPGGCFLALTSMEYGAQAGPVHDALVTVLGRWRRTLLRDIRQAIDDGDLPAGTDAEQVAFVLEALADGTKRARQLHGDIDVARRCLSAMHATLGAAPVESATTG
ncbi:AcrR family transcriptional regulator [Nocardioides thalensis]|uniref:AcrR family transcriptional regulator n=1 Tax=Nocardioides thalensis TaxID=1914755 RepID=A0A853C850_9ACTN|nr:TetR/AcrR family transcriptional regulator [Nocardioides thalensis]NYJ02403.1 AcrR family transcriptional regulator [Nocardioides thalensis]